MLVTRDIISELETLPREYLPEVYGFIASLKAKQPGEPAAKAARPKPTGGAWAGRIQVSDDFDAPLDDMREYME